MTSYFTHPITRFAAKFTTISFALGILIFLIFLGVESDDMAVFGLLYFGIFMSINKIIIFVTGLIALTNLKRFSEFAAAILLLVLNAIVALLCLHISLNF